MSYQENEVLWSQSLESKSQHFIFIHLQMGLVSLSVYPCQAFPAYCNVMR